MKRSFYSKAWADYEYWINENPKFAQKINRLLKDISRNHFEGLGHPKPLTGNLAGWWSRKIDDEHRLIYRISDDETIEIIQCKGHYDDK